MAAIDDEIDRVEILLKLLVQENQVLRQSLHNIEAADNLREAVDIAYHVGALVDGIRKPVIAHYEIADAAASA